jgi:hypothetical protein
MAVQQGRPKEGEFVMRSRKGAMVALSAALILGTSLGGAAFGASAGASARHAARPHGVRHAAAGPMTPVSGTPTVFEQEFTENTKYFCPGLGNAACDGGVGDYGTIDRVPSGFSNGGVGNYAPSTAALAGNFFALTSGSQAQNQGGSCPGGQGTPEYCSGPYALFPVNGETSSDWGNSDVFPSRGFTVTDDLYLSPTTAPGPSGNTVITPDVEINSSTDAGSPTYYYGQDDIINACYDSTAGGSNTPGFVISFNTDVLCPSPEAANAPVVTSDGWYRFVWVFSNVSGYAYVTENVYSEPASSNSLVATTGPQPVTLGGNSAVRVSAVGGPGYFWLPGEEVSGLPLTNLAVQDGQHPTGYTPTT